MWGVGSEGKMTSCVDASWGRGNTEGMEPGTEAGKPGGRFWCRAGCPRPEEQKCSVQAREPTWNSGFPLLGGQERKTSNPKTASQSALGALTIGMSPHPQGGTSGAGQPVGVGRVGVGGRVPAQLAALHHEVGGQVSRTAARRVDPGKFHEVFVVSVRSLVSAWPPPLP